MNTIVGAHERAQSRKVPIFIRVLRSLLELPPTHRETYRYIFGGLRIQILKLPVSGWDVAECFANLLLHTGWDLSVVLAGGPMPSQQ